MSNDKQREEEKRKVGCSTKKYGYESDSNSFGAWTYQFSLRRPFAFWMLWIIFWYALGILTAPYILHK